MSETSGRNTFVGILLSLALVLGVLNACSEMRKFDERRQQTASLRDACEAKLKALGYVPPASDGANSGHRGEPTKQDELCQQIRSAEAAQIQAILAGRQFWSSILNLIFVIAATVAAGCAAYFAKQAAKYTERGARANEEAASHADKELKLSNPPRLKFAAPIVFDGDLDAPVIPKFTAGGRYRGQAHLINYGRYPAQIMKSGGRYETDCYAYFSKGDRFSMVDYYRRVRSSEAHVQIVDTYSLGSKLPILGAGDLFTWNIDVVMPNDFKIGDDGRWSHDLYFVARARYLGAAGEARGVYFCKKYVPQRDNFEAVPEYENED